MPPAKKHKVTRVGKKLTPLEKKVKWFCRNSSRASDDRAMLPSGYRGPLPSDGRLKRPKRKDSLLPGEMALEFLHLVRSAYAALPPCLAERLRLSGISLFACWFFGEAAPRRLRRSLSLETRSQARPGKAKPFRKTGRRSRWPPKATIGSGIRGLKCRHSRALSLG